MERADLIKAMYNCFNLFNAYFFNGLLKEPAIIFEQDSSETLNHFVTYRDKNKSVWIIKINKKHLYNTKVNNLKNIIQSMIYIWQ